MPFYLSPELKQRQDEWERLYLSSPKTPIAGEADADVATPVIWEGDREYALCRVYFLDALHGHNIEYPQSPFELKCLQLSRSPYLSAVFEMVCIVHIAVPFLRAPYCAWADDSNPNEAAESKFDRFLHAVEALCVLVYLMEFFLATAVSNLSNRFLKLNIRDMWHVLRAICIALLFMEFIFSWSLPGLI